MAVIVEQKEMKRRFVVIGTGYGSFRSERPSLFFGNLLPNVKADELSLVAVCNAEGRIGWCPSHELRVVSIDGKSPAELLS